MDQEKMKEGISAFLEGADVELDDEDRMATAERVARAWANELLSGYSVDIGETLTWTDTAGTSGPVIVRDISFSSVCVHHLLPFHGMAHVAYIPRTRLAGLSKIGRVVEALARRLQIQEQLTEQIADSMESVLEPQGVLVTVEAKHTCMTLRGARKENSSLLTMASRGILEKDIAARSEILRLLGRRW